ncbi:MAG: TM2 domain-containing protein [Bacteroidota bacterium]|nr:TM2 domain-containing protein [Bacteroidota bacterium]MDX5404563.1 TM2 domain-containing protein [Bacteroidota bacterium]MDX5428081.1 TM2 domain-containing protein [Bacteroidota bacterium]MDX5447913.1 TM2 domain-containing protein [Bacteroidota bacterium]MDX5505905.1 TM2 domain-containing protein [Bacteroidota bacterium]
MNRVLRYIPEASGEEMIFLDQFTREFGDEEMERFAFYYRAKRKDPQTVLILTILGFVIVAGVQRLYLNQIGMGILYLLTGGLCLIGTIVDLVNYQNLAKDFNITVAEESFRMMKS